MVLGWSLLFRSASIAGQIRKLDEFARGGFLTDVLVALGEVHLDSAVEHLRQAATSTDPRSRLGQAAGDFQTAYFAYEKASHRGVRAWRRVRDAERLENEHALASGCAGSIALLQWYLKEAPQNLRAWLDRSAKHLSESWIDLRARDTSPVISRTEWAETYTHRLMQFEPMATAYFNLEREVLPPELLRPRPVGRRLAVEVEESEALQNEARRLKELGGPEYHLPAYEDG